MKIYTDDIGKELENSHVVRNDDTVGRHYDAAKSSSMIRIIDKAKDEKEPKRVLYEEWETLGPYARIEKIREDIEICPEIIQDCERMLKGSKKDRMLDMALKMFVIAAVIAAFWTVL